MACPIPQGAIMKTQICMEKALCAVDVPPIGLNEICSERTTVVFQHSDGGPVRHMATGLPLFAL